LFVGEDFDLDDAFRLTGLFSAHWEDPDGGWVPRGANGGAGRPFGSALDGSEQVVTYALASAIRGDALPLERVRAALERDPEIADVGVEPASQGSVEVRYEVRAAATGAASLESTAVVETR
jgi:hypothetical protein